MKSRLDDECSAAHIWYTKNEEHLIFQAFMDLQDECLTYIKNAAKQKLKGKRKPSM